MTYLRFVELEKSPNKIQNQLLSMRHFLVQFDSLFSRGSNASGVYLRAIPRNSTQFCPTDSPSVLYVIINLFILISRYCKE